MQKYQKNSKELTASFGYCCGTGMCFCCSSQQAVATTKLTRCKAIAVRRSVFRPFGWFIRTSATVSRDGLVEPCMCRRCHCCGGPPPHHPHWLTTHHHHHHHTPHWLTPLHYHPPLADHPTPTPTTTPCLALSRDGWQGRSAFTLTKRTCWSWKGTPVIILNLLCWKDNTKWSVYTQVSEHTAPTCMSGIRNIFLFDRTVHNH